VKIKNSEYQIRHSRWVKTRDAKVPKKIKRLRGFYFGGVRRVVEIGRLLKKTSFEATKTEN